MSILLWLYELMLSPLVVSFGLLTIVYSIALYVVWDFYRYWYIQAEHYRSRMNGLQTLLDKQVQQSKKNVHRVIPCSEKGCKNEQ